jgi:hypothetical protein
VRCLPGIWEREHEMVQVLQIQDMPAVPTLVIYDTLLMIQLLRYVLCLWDGTPASEEQADHIVSPSSKA